MGKPEFTKEFNLEHAKAGAPYCQKDGDTAVVLKWDLNGRYRMVGYGSNSDTGKEMGMRWMENGVPDGLFGDACELVMTPLGMIDGKPVFVGDEFTNFHGAHVLARPMWRDFQGCKWPAPARIYPVTKMSGAELDRVYMATPDNEKDEDFIAVANAALRHAIDAKQVITADEHKAEIADLHSKWVAQITEMNGKRAARDMAIAREVRGACIACNPMDLDLVDVICGVTP